MDMRLPQLRTLTNPKLIAPYLQACTGVRTEIRKVTVLKYKPERTCVIRYYLRGHFEKSPSARVYSLIGKTFHNDQGAEVFQVMQFLKMSEIPVPEPFAYIPELKLLVTQALCGRELLSLVADPNFPMYMKRAAQAVAGLHRVAVDHKIAKRVSSLEEEAQSFAHTVELFQQDCAPMRKKVDHVASTIVSKLKNCRAEPLTFVHGELDLSQLMVHDSKIWFVDFDNFRISHPATDVGRFLAYLTKLSLAFYHDPGRLRTMQNLFLEEYLSSFPNDLKTPILICYAMECLKISFRQFQRRKSNWKFRVSSMFKVAEKASDSVRT